MIDRFKITIFPSKVKPIQISLNDSAFISARSYIRNNFSIILLKEIKNNEEENDYEGEDYEEDYEEDDYEGEDYEENYEKDDYEGEDYEENYEKYDYEGEDYEEDYEEDDYEGNDYEEDYEEDDYEGEDYEEDEEVGEFNTNDIFKDLSKKTKKLINNNENEYYEGNDDEEEDDFIGYVLNKDYVISKIESIYNNLNNQSAPIIIEDNLFYHLGWKQLYNKYVYLDADQKERDLELYTEDNQTLAFYQLDNLVSLLKSYDTEFTMTTFAFTLFSATKSLYKAPKNSSVNDIRLSALVKDKATEENSRMVIEKIIKTVVRHSICFDFTTGKPQKNPIKEYYESFSSINHAPYTVNYVDYPIIVNKTRNCKCNPNKYFDFSSASPIFINYIDTSTSKKSMYISVYPQTNISNEKEAPQTQYLSFLESKLSSKADEKFKSKEICNHLIQEITDIIIKPNEDFLSLDLKEMTKIENCIFGLLFHKNQKVTYFDDLYNSAKKILSYPDCDPERVRIYSYLLASLMSFKEYVDELPIKNPYEISFSDEYDDTEYTKKIINYENSGNDDDSPVDPFIEKICSEVNDRLEQLGLNYNCELYNETDQYENDNDSEESTPPPPPRITDISSYKEEFYTLFDQTVEIFKKRCAVNDNADITMSYDDKLIQHFDRFITELVTGNSDIIITPSRKKNGLLYLDFYRYYEHFELYLSKQKFHYNITKQKFNRLLYDNGILKPRYHGSEKTPPKLDYILKSNKEEYTVLAVNLEILKIKCEELSK